MAKALLRNWKGIRNVQVSIVDEHTDDRLEIEIVCGGQRERKRAKSLVFICLQNGERMQSFMKCDYFLLTHRDTFSMGPHTKKKHSLMVVLTVPIASVWIVNRWLYWCCDVLDLAIIVAWNWARFCDRFFLHKFISFSSEIMKHSVCQFEKNIRHVFNISIWFWSCKQWIWSSNSFRWNTMSHRAK